MLKISKILTHAIYILLILLITSCQLHTVKQVTVKGEPEINLALSNQGFAFEDIFDSLLSRFPSGTEINRSSDNSISILSIPPAFHNNINTMDELVKPKEFIEFPQASFSIFGEPNEFTVTLYADPFNHRTLLSNDPVSICIPHEDSTISHMQGLDIGLIDFSYASFTAGKLYIDLELAQPSDPTIEVEITDARLVHGDGSTLDAAGPTLLEADVSGVLEFDLTGKTLQHPVTLNFSYTIDGSDDNSPCLEVIAYPNFSDDTEVCCAAGILAQHIHIPILSHPLDFQLEESGIQQAVISQGTVDIAVTFPDTWNISLDESESAITLEQDGDSVAVAQFTGNSAAIPLDIRNLDSSYSLTASLVISQIDNQPIVINYRDPIQIEASVRIDVCSLITLLPGAMETQLQGTLLEPDGLLTTLYKGFLTFRDWLSGSNSLLTSPKKIICSTSELQVTMHNESPFSVEFSFTSQSLLPETRTFTVPGETQHTVTLSMNTEIELNSQNTLPVNLTVRPANSSELTNIPSGVFAVAVSAEPLMTIELLELGEFSETREISLDGNSISNVLRTFNSFFPKEIQFFGVEGEMHFKGLSEMDGTIVLLAKYNNTVIELLGSLRPGRRHNFSRFGNYTGAPLAPTMKINPGALDTILNSRSSDIELAYRVQADHIVFEKPFSYTSGISVSFPLVLHIQPGDTASLDFLFSRRDENSSKDQDFLNRSHSNDITTQMLYQTEYAAFHFAIDNSLGIYPVWEITHGVHNEFYLRKEITDNSSIILSREDIKYMARTYPFDPEIRLFLEPKDNGHVLNPEGTLCIQITMQLGMDIDYVLPLGTWEYY